MTGLGDLMAMMRDLGTLRQKVAEAQAELERLRVDGRSADGRVTAAVSGRLELVDLKIGPASDGADDAPRLEAAVKEAVGQAIEKARANQREMLTKLLGGLSIPPGLMDMLG